MDKDGRELVSRLFAVTTEILEDAHPLAMAGQSQNRSCRRYRSLAASLRKNAIELVAILDTILLLAAVTARKPGRKT